MPVKETTRPTDIGTLKMAQYTRGCDCRVIQPMPIIQASPMVIALMKQPKNNAEQDAELRERYEPLVPMFEEMAKLAKILRNRRMTRGAIDFDFKESKVLVDEDGHPTDIVIRERSTAEKLIEEFMLVANETVAEHFHWLNVPFMYRVHEDPKEEKLLTAQEGYIYIWIKKDKIEEKQEIKKSFITEKKINAPKFVSGGFE